MSRRVPLDALLTLQHRPANIRNICILAHVDHGKTTLADGLISSNGIISDKMSGKIRFMDYLEDEQQRGITMKSSAISLHFRDEATGKQREAGADYLINLIDSPGHVDFSSDVSTAVRVCDGAIVVVDVVEGVCIQAWNEGVRPILLINKIDRLVEELQLEPGDAYLHICRLLEQINVMMGSLFVADVFAKSREGGEEEEGAGAELDFDEDAESDVFFSPARGNVVFASARDGWAFTLDQFAAMHAERLGVRKKALRRCLWGDYTVNTKKSPPIEKLSPSSKRPRAFTQLVLTNLWAVHGATVMARKPKKLRKICAALNLTVPDRELDHSDARQALRAVMRRWLPVSQGALGAVVRRLPGAVEAQAARVERLLPSLPEAAAPHAMEGEGEEGTLAALRSAFVLCSSSADAPVVAFVSKMLAVPVEQLPDAAAYTQGPAGDEAEDGVLATHAAEAVATRGEVFLAFVRVFSGTLTRDSSLFVLPPSYNPISREERAALARVRGNLRLYLMMGQALEEVEEVPAGNVCAVAGLGAHVLKTATLVSTPACPPLAGLTLQATPIVKVAVAPKEPMHLARLRHGLRLLNKADPCVEVSVHPSGEHVLAALGELHLERCIKELETRFARVPLAVSSPLVSFRETVAPPEEDAASPTADGGAQWLVGQTDAVERGGEEQGEEAGSTTRDPDVWEEAGESAAPVTVRDVLEAAATGDGATRPLPLGLVPTYAPVARVCAGRSVGITLRAAPVPQALCQVLDREESAVQAALAAGDLHASVSSSHAPSAEAGAGAASGAAAGAGADHRHTASLVARVRTAFREHSEAWGQVFDRVWALGPRRRGACLLVNNLPAGHGADLQSFWEWLQSDAAAATRARAEQGAAAALENALHTGFQTAASCGPLCEEPLWGVAFIVDAVECTSAEEDAAAAAAGSLSARSGEFMACVKDAMRTAVQRGSPRLVEAMLRCQVQCSMEQLGNMHGVISKRRGQVLREDLWEGTYVFTVECIMPVAESFGFAEELRVKTSGAAGNPQMMLAHWQALDMDPFFQPRTEDEREEHGEQVYEVNLAKKYVDSVRKRKGLVKEERTVLHAEKQRTRSRKK